MRRIFGAMAVMAALLAAGGAYAQEAGDTQDDSRVGVEPGSDASRNPDPGAEQRTAQPQGEDPEMQPAPPAQPDQGGGTQGQCQCPCPQEQQGY